MSSLFDSIIADPEALLAEDEALRLEARQNLWKRARSGAPAPEVDTSEADRMADPSIRRGVPGFFLGDNDPNTMNLGEKVGTALNVGGESLTFGLVGDEAAAAVDDAIGRGDYDDRLAKYRGDEQQFADENPVAYTGALLAPALMPAGAGARAVAAAPSLAGKVVTSGLLGGAGGGLYGFMEGEGDAASRVDDGVNAATFGGAVGAAAPIVARLAGAIGRGVQNRRAGKEIVENARSVEQLAGDAGDLYDEARRVGVTASGDQTAAVAERALAKLREEGLARPDGSLPAGYTKVKDALETIMAFTDDAMTPAQMQNVRRQLMEAARQPGTEGMIGSAFVKSFDEVMEPLAPQIKQGNALYARSKKGEMLETMAEEAKRKAGTNYTSAGYEHALRKEYSNLLGRINRGLEDGFSEAEIEAIRRVAEGGPIENALRAVGKYTPAGPVSAGLSFGIPAMVGNTFGLAPGTIGALGATGWAAGAAGRSAATAMQRRNADIASALVRSGTQLPVPTAPKVNPAILRALMAGAAPTGMATTAGPQ